MKSLPSHLRVHRADEASAAPTSRGLDRWDLDQLLNHFAEATGWRVRALGGRRTSARTQGASVEAELPLQERFELICDCGMDGVLDATADFPASSQQAAWALLAQIDALMRTLRDTEAAVERQEAQLASHLGVSIRPDESEVLASKMQESLQRAAEQTASDAAALYLLDDATSELKMRSCWGLPTAALAKPARPLRGALADLEALLGNAVLLENTSLAREWNCPEDFQASLCLPIGSPTTPYGTLWLWSNQIRDFSSADIDAAKCAADKILADIERSVLADEVLRLRTVGRGMESAGLIQSTRLPDRQPLHADYDIAGWTNQGQALGGNFHTWTLNPQGQLIVALGAAELPGPSGALIAITLQTVVETCWNAKHDPRQVMRRANDLLWSAEEGDWRCSMSYLQLDPETGLARHATAGSVQTFVIDTRGYRLLSGSDVFLGAQPDARFSSLPVRLEAGQLLVIASAALVGGAARGGLSQSGFLDTIRQLHEEPVEAIADHLARQLPMESAEGKLDIARSLVIMRRRF